MKILLIKPIHFIIVKDVIPNQIKFFLTKSVFLSKCFQNMWSQLHRWKVRERLFKLGEWGEGGAFLFFGNFFRRNF
jgi:hypothetical protein